MEADHLSDKHAVHKSFLSPGKAVRWAQSLVIIFLHMRKQLHLEVMGIAQGH